MLAANRILTVGAAARARLVAQFLDATPAPVTSVSSRGFETITGHFKGVHVSIVSIGMGAAMMDFFVREVRAVVDGPMAIIRYGTCGGLGPDALPGKVVCASGGASFVGRNYDYFVEGAETKKPYTMYKVNNPPSLPPCLPIYLIH
jgi:uridine phosphorylase